MLQILFKCIVFWREWGHPGDLMPAGTKSDLEWKYGSGSTLVMETEVVPDM